MQIGDKVSCKLYASGTRKNGKVVFVHPTNGFFVAEFDFGNGVKYRESYFNLQTNYEIPCQGEGKGRLR